MTLLHDLMIEKASKDTKTNPTDHKEQDISARLKN